MFNKNNFCHVASNNRNEQKAGLFVYKTTDALATVTTSGYFNEKIVDINLHDLIIHEWHDNADRTKVQRNLLCVTERTLENVGTSVIKSKWEGDIEQAIADLETYVNTNFLKLDGTNIMTGPLKMRSSVSFKCAIAPSWDGVGFYKLNDNDSLTLMASMEATDGLTPAQNNTYNIGKSSHKWKDAHIARVITSVINNGYDIAVPATAEADTLALKSQVDLAANSGRMITDEGVWYAKMDAAGTIPAEAAVEGRNYADFTQVDGNGDPIIVIYTYTSGAWTQTETITPPAAYDGYVPVTSKIWDIAEQAGQQGGRILWNHQSKEFTPYPVIISFEDAHLTGDSTVVMPLTPSGSSIVNVDYLTTHTGSGKNVGDVFFTMRTDSGLSGAVECDGDTYNTTDFVGAGAISALLEAGKIPYVSLAQYTTLLSTNGSVGVFGWDGVGTTAFRVPYLNDIFIETGTATQIGDYVAPGLPNITANAAFSYGTLWPTTLSGAFKSSGNVSTRAQGEGGTSPGNIELDASLSSSIYGNSTTVQPNTVRYRAMVQLATGATDEALETCTAVTAQVASNTAAIAGADYVVESQLPTAQNNYTWYRKYKSGWVEQGGTTSITSTADGVVATLAIEMADTNYSVTATPVINDNAWIGVWVNRVSATQVKVDMYNTSGSRSRGTATWEVKGVMAQP